MADSYRLNDAADFLASSQQTPSIEHYRKLALQVLANHSFTRRAITLNYFSSSLQGFPNTPFWYTLAALDLAS